MLVLTRSIGERLIIGNGEVCLHVLEVRGNQVRIGIDAPRHIPVHREEIYKRITAKPNDFTFDEMKKEKAAIDIEK